MEMKAMSDAAMDRVLGYLVESREVLQRAIDDLTFCRAIRDIAEVSAKALESGKKLLLAGNGGSAGDAQHLAGEMLSRLNYDRAPAAAISLTTDSSVLTAIGNDYGYERVFERQILGLAEHPAGDRRGPRKGAEGCWFYRQNRRRDGCVLRSMLTCPVGFDAADPADPYHRRPHHLRPR
jgi:SIS domain